MMRRDRLAIAAMFLANGFVIGVWATQIPGLLPRFGISTLVLGLLILALGVGAVGVMPFAGRLISERGAGWTGRLFALPLSLSMLMIALAPNLAYLSVAVVLLGLFAGGMDVAMNASAVAVERRHGRAIMSQSHGFWSLGGFAGGASGAVVTAQAGGMATALMSFMVCALLILPSAGHLARHYSQPEAPRADEVPGARRLLPRDPALWLLGVMALAAMVPEGAVLDWAAIYLSRELAAGATLSGMAFAAFSGAMAVMRFAGDRLRMRFGAVRALRVSAFVGAAGLGIAALSPSPALALAGFALAGLGIANLVPVLFSAAGNHPGVPSGQAMSLVTMIGYSGILAAPGLIGFVADHIGLATTYAILSSLLLVVGLLAPRASAADQRPQEARSATA